MSGTTDLPDALETELPPFDPFAVLASLAAAIVERALLVLPSVEPTVSVPYLLAVWQHAAQDTEGTFSEALRCQLETERLNADDATRCDLVDSAPAFGYLQADTSTLTLPASPGANPRHKVRTDGTVRGRRNAEVIGRNAHGEMVRHSGDDLIRQADMLLHAAGATGDLLIGSEVYDWHQVVAWSPISHTMHDGQTIYLAPEGAGDSLVWASLTGRKRIAHKPRRATYSTRPISQVDVEGWGTDSDALRIVKRYQTSIRLGTDGVSRCVGHGAWATSAKRATRRPRAARTALPTLTMPGALAMLRETIAAGYVAKHEVRATCIVNGVRITVRNAPDRRVFPVTVSIPGIKPRKTNARTLDAALRAVERYATV